MVRPVDIYYLFFPPCARKKNRMSLLPHWAREAGSPVGRLLVRITDGDNIVIQDVQTLRILCAIHAVLNSNAVRLHPKMREVDVLDLQRFSQYVSGLLPSPQTIESSACKTLQRFRYKCLCALMALIRRSTQHLGLWTLRDAQR